VLCDQEVSATLYYITNFVFHVLYISLYYTCLVQPRIATFVLEVVRLHTEKSSDKKNNTLVIMLIWTLNVKQLARGWLKIVPVTCFITYWHLM